MMYISAVLLSRICSFGLKIELFVPIILSFLFFTLQLIFLREVPSLGNKTKFEIVKNFERALPTVLKSIFYYYCYEIQFLI